jgi:hypothetical protein
MIHYRVNKSPILVPILKQINPAHALLSYLYDIFLNLYFTTKGNGISVTCHEETEGSTGADILIPNIGAR